MCTLRKSWPQRNCWPGNCLGAREKDRTRTSRNGFHTAANCHSQQTNEFLLANSPPGLIKTFPEQWVCWSVQIKQGEMFPLCISECSSCFRPCMQHLLGHWPAGVRALNFLLHQAAQRSCSSPGSCLPAPAPLCPPQNRLLTSQPYNLQQQ